MRKRTRARRPFTSIVGLALTLTLLAPAGMSSATAATITAQTPAITQNTATSQDATVFTDVRPGRVFYDEISWLAANGISNGWTLRDGTKVFRPDERVLRDQMAAFMYRLAGEPAYTPPETSPFTDVSPSHVFYKEISWLAEEGISNGWSAPGGTRIFGPGRPVLRDQMAAFMYRLAGEPAYTPPATSKFTDVRPGQVFDKEISWLAESGVSNGWSAPGGTRIFGPYRQVLRDQMAAFMYRFHNEGLLEQDAPVEATLAVVEDPIVSGIAGLDYTQVFTATGASGTVTWSATGLPAGLELGADGVLTGTPSTVGTSTVSIAATDAAGARDVYTTTLAVVDEIPDECLGQVCSIVTPSEDTVEVPAAAIAGITRDAATNRVQTVILNGAAPTVGQILVLAPTEQTPTGATVRVDHVESGAGGSTAATVTPVLISEAFPHGIVHATDDGADAMMQGQAATAEGDKTPGDTAPGTPGLEVGDMVLECTAGVEYQLDNMSVTPTFTPTLYAQWGNPFFGVGDVFVGTGDLELYQVNLDGQMEMKLGASMSGEGSCTVGSEVSVPVPAGNTGRIILSMAPSVTFEVSGQTEISTSVILTCGTQYRYFHGEESSQAWCKDEHQPLGVNGDSGVDASLVGAIDTSVTWNDLIGVTGMVNAGLYATYRPAGDPIAELRAKSEGELGGCLACFWEDTPLQVTILSTEFYNQVLAEYKAAPPPPTVTGPPVLQDATMHPTETGVPTERTFFVTGGTKPYVFTRTAGTFPPGMSLDAATGKLTGTPTRAGEYEFTVQVTDARGRSDTTSSFLIVFGEDVVPEANRLLATTMDSGSAGNYVVKPDGTVWAWASSYTSAVQAPQGADPAHPFPLVGPNDTKQVAAGYDTGYALQHDGTVWTWGHADDGMMGIGPSDYQIYPHTPMKIPGLTDIVSITATNSAVYAVKADGTVLTWGRNWGKLLGLGDSVADNETVWSPTPIPGLRNIVTIEAGTSVVYALTKDGRVHAWGSNNWGQLGNTRYEEHSAVPQLIEGLDGVVDLAADDSTGYAVKADGTVWGWGFTMDDPATDFFMIQWYGKPTALPYISGVQKMDAGDNKIFALKKDRTLWSWGATTYPGPLGIGEQRNPNAPVQLNHLSDVVDVFSGKDNGFAITGDGSLWGWGELGRHYTPEGAPHGMVLEPIRLKN